MVKITNDIPGINDPLPSHTAAEVEQALAQARSATAKAERSSATKVLRAALAKVQAFQLDRCIEKALRRHVVSGAGVMDALAARSKGNG